MKTTFQVTAHDRHELARAITREVRTLPLGTGEKRYKVVIEELTVGTLLPGEAPDFGGTPGPGFDPDHD